MGLGSPKEPDLFFLFHTAPFNRPGIKIFCYCQKVTLLGIFYQVEEILEFFGWLARRRITTIDMNPVQLDTHKPSLISSLSLGKSACCMTRLLYRSRQLPKVACRDFCIALTKSLCLASTFSPSAWADLVRPHSAWGWVVNTWLSLTSPLLKCPRVDYLLLPATCLQFSLPFSSQSTLSFTFADFVSSLALHADLWFVDLHFSYMTSVQTASTSSVGLSRKLDTPSSRFWFYQWPRSSWPSRLQV